MWHSIPLTLFWFVYFGSLGIFYPYFALYLRENAGLTGTQVGLILAISPFIGMLTQPFWGHLADRTGARSRMLAFLTLGTALGYWGLGIVEGFWPIVLVTAEGRHAFGRVRVWGTIGYFILILAFPWMLAAVQPPIGSASAVNSAQPGLGLMFPITASLVFGAALIAFLLPKAGAVALRAARGDWRELAHNRAFLRFLLFALIAHFLMHGPMWLFPLFVRSRGGDIGTIRNMWILMLLFEIPLVLQREAA